MFKIAVAGAAMLGAYAYNKYRQEQEITTKEYILRANLTQLIDATGKQNIIDGKETLINDLLNSRQAGIKEKQIAWQSVIKTLNPEYYVARDNTKKFNIVTPHIKALADVVSNAIQDLNGNLADNAGLAADVVQFIFKVSNYYSIASTLDQNNFDECTKWLLQAREFIIANGLQDTLQHSIWHNLIGGHKSREYQMGRNRARPVEAVEHFKEAVRIHNEKLCSNLDNRNDIELRHVQMCLSSTMLQDAMWCVVNEGNISKQVERTIENAKSLLAALTPERLVLKDGAPDLYRQAGCLQAEGYVLILEGNFNAAIQKMSAASEMMENAIGNTGATGQLSAILNDEAAAWLAFAACNPNQLPNSTEKAKLLLNKSKRISEGQFEQMYAENAQQILEQIERDPTECFYYTLAASVINPTYQKAALKPNM